ncbi:MAG: hypothetical protein HY814_13365 [Candidatus Riflebacteria bacterium]|nr:hypothetical protein [Candidatus Riflebacteria bacterium]
MASRCKSQFKNVELTQLSRVEREAVDSFSRCLVAKLGTQVASISVHGLRCPVQPESREMNLLVLLKKANPVMESQVEELALDQFIESGIYLQVRCFEQKQFNQLRKMRLPAVTEMQRDAISLWAA